MSDIWGPECMITLGMFILAAGILIFSLSNPKLKIDSNRIIEECKAERGMMNSLRRWKKI